ncbi:MAG: cation transporter [Deltaproteobacteria bacterium]|nr:MAG: cation transporter [Deltaproteobacteria bacterium]
MSCSAVRSPNDEDCASCERNAPLVAAILNLLLAIFLMFIGFVSGSKAILGNSLYSFKDFITALAVFIGIRVSERPADSTHPYGHGKVEFVAMLFIGVAIFIASLFLFFHSVREIWAAWQGRLEVPGLIALCAGCISVIANYKLYKYLLCVGNRQNHPAILAAAKHHHSDAMASVFVVLAIIGANMGLMFLDPLVAVFETLDLMWLSVVMLKDGLNGALDGSAQAVGIRSEIESIGRLVPGVRKVSNVGVRQMGQDRWIDITIKVDHDTSAGEGYLIGLRVKESIMKALENIANVAVSIEPYMP